MLVGVGNPGFWKATFSFPGLACSRYCGFAAGWTYDLSIHIPGLNRYAMWLDNYYNNNYYGVFVVLYDSTVFQSQAFV